MKRYLAEYDFRYNERAGLGVTDAERATKALKGIEGKRLTYRRIDGQEEKRARKSRSEKLLSHWNRL